MAPLRYAHPLVMDEIAIRFPDLTVVMAHIGHPWQADTIAVIRKHPNVWADVSAGLLPPVVVLHGDAPRDRVERAAQAAARARTTRSRPSAETIAGMHALNDIPRASGLPGIPEAAIEAIIERDALACLGLERPS